MKAPEFIRIWIDDHNINVGVGNVIELSFGEHRQRLTQYEVVGLSGNAIDIRRKFVCDAKV